MSANIWVRCLNIEDFGVWLSLLATVPGDGSGPKKTNPKSLPLGPLTFSSFMTFTTASAIHSQVYTLSFIIP